MSPQTLRILIAGALLVHGIGHTLGFFKPVRSWLLPSVSEASRRAIASTLWSLAAIGFVLSGLAFFGLLVPAPWWRPLAIVSCIPSLLGLLIFVGNWPVFNTVAALAFNIVVLVALLWYRWPPTTLFGR